MPGIEIAVGGENDLPVIRSKGRGGLALPGTGQLPAAIGCNIVKEEVAIFGVSHERIV